MKYLIRNMPIEMHTKLKIMSAERKVSMEYLICDFVSAGLRGDSSVRVKDSKSPIVSCIYCRRVLIDPVHLIDHYCKSNIEKEIVAPIMKSLNSFNKKEAAVAPVGHKPGCSCLRCKPPKEKKINLKYKILESHVED